MLTEYYFDIETVPLELYRNVEKAGTDPSMAKIISIQYQHLDGRTGQPFGELQILKEWESSEKTIVEQFRQVYLTGIEWDFIPIGNNLLFESRFMKHKLKQYCNAEGLKLGQRPMIDLKHTLVMANNGSFKGYDRLLGKSSLAANMAEWYYSKNYSMIEQYITKEASDFIKAYAVLKRELPGISLL